MTSGSVARSAWTFTASSACGHDWHALLTSPRDLGIGRVRAIPADPARLVAGVARTHNLTRELGCRSHAVPAGRDRPRRVGDPKSAVQAGYARRDIGILLTYLLILWGVIALAYLLAWWLGKRRGEPKPGEFSDALMFIGFLFSVLLGLLQVFAVNHYTDARTQAETEATTLVAMFDDMSLFPPRVSITAQRDVICYMRSVTGQDWKAQEDEHSTEAPDTVVRGDRLRSLRRTLPLASARDQSAYGRITQELGDAGTARQQLLFLARPQIPTILWAVVFVSAGVLLFLLVSEFRSRPVRIARTALVAAIVVMSFEIGSLATLDHPFGSVARVQPDAMQRALGLLGAGRHGDPALANCGPVATLGA